jgi:hypothetical protein
LWLNVASRYRIHIMSKPNQKASTRTRLLRACYSFLVPVARFLLRHGISFSEFSEVSRMAFVEVAGTDYGIRGRPTNISRVSAMTGIGRKEVSRLRRLKAEYPENSPRVELSPLSDVLQRWFTDPDFLDSKGQPRRLPYRSGKRSFARLVKTCAGDLPAGAIKVELIRCGAVVEDHAGGLFPQRRYVVPEGLDEKVISSLVFGLRGLAATIAFNSSPAALSAEDFGRIERFAESDPLTEEGIASIRGHIRQRISNFASGMDDLLAQADRSVRPSGRRIGVGVFYYEDD